MPAREGFFPRGIWIRHFDWSTFSHANGLAGVAPGAILLPRGTCFMQDTSNGVRTHVGETIRRTTQCTLERHKRPGGRPIQSAISSASKLPPDPLTLDRGMLPPESHAAHGAHR